MSIFSKLTSGGEKPVAAPPPPPVVAAPKPVAAKLPAYGIDDALKLVRSLPFDSNPELVAWVMKNTLSSLHVDIDALVDEATGRQESIRTRIAGLHAEIVALEGLLAEKRAAVITGDSELSEISSLRRRLDTAAPPRPAPQARQSVAPTATPAASPAPAAPPVVAAPASTPAAPVAAPAAPAAPAVTAPVAATVEVIEEEAPFPEYTAPPGAPLPTAHVEAGMPGAGPSAVAPAPAATPIAEPAPAAAAAPAPAAPMAVASSTATASRVSPGARSGDTRANTAARNAGAGMRESPYAKS